MNEEEVSYKNTSPAIGTKEGPNGSSRSYSADGKYTTGEGTDTKEETPNFSSSMSSDAKAASSLTPQKILSCLRYIKSMSFLNPRDQIIADLKQKYGENSPIANLENHLIDDYFACPIFEEEGVEILSKIFKRFGMKTFKPKHGSRQQDTSEGIDYLMAVKNPDGTTDMISFDLKTLNVYGNSNQYEKSNLTCWLSKTAKGKTVKGNFINPKHINDYYVYMSVDTPLTRNEIKEAILSGKKYNQLPINGIKIQVFKTNMFKAIINDKILSDEELENISVEQSEDVQNLSIYELKDKYGADFIPGKEIRQKFPIAHGVFEENAPKAEVLTKIRKGGGTETMLIIPNDAISKRYISFKGFGAQKERKY